MTEKRFILKQNGNFHTVIDTVENKPMGVFEFKENEFPVYACFHMIIDKMNELHEESQSLSSQVMLYKSELDVCANQNKKLERQTKEQFDLLVKARKQGFIDF